jgi:predicted nucleic acid-binding protein
VEWLKPLYGHIVGLDSAPLIYFIEKHPAYLPLIRPFFEAVERGQIQVVTSTLTLTEVLIHPLRHGNQRQHSSIPISS